MGNKTPLYDKHVEAGARIVDFGGWDMPLHYGSQKQEHHAVRGNAGVFDVSHMTIVDVAGDGARAFLRRLLANDVAKLDAAGRALYSCMLNEAGGVIDDLIAYYFDATNYRLIVNAATRDKDLAWIRGRAEASDVRISERAELAMLAVQGPQARELAASCIDTEWRDAALALRPFHGMYAGEVFVARTGYTGEDGFELVLPAANAPVLWDRLLAAGTLPCGLGARDTLRLEAAMNLYGNDMDETVSPLESGLAGRWPGSLPSAISSAGRRWKPCAGIPAGGVLPGCCSKIAACCATGKRWWWTVSARVQSRPAVSRRR